MIAQIYKSNQSLKLLKDKLHEITSDPKYMLPFLAIGRVVHVIHNGVDWGWGVSLNFSQKKVAIKKGKKK